MPILNHFIPTGGTGGGGASTWEELQNKPFDNEQVIVAYNEDNPMEFDGDIIYKVAECPASLDVFCGVTVKAYINDVAVTGKTADEMYGLDGSSVTPSDDFFIIDFTALYSHTYIIATIIGEELGMLGFILTGYSEFVGLDAGIWLAKFPTTTDADGVATAYSWIDKIVAPSPLPAMYVPYQAYTTTLAADAWVAGDAHYAQTISVPGIKASTCGMIGIADEATDEQYNAATEAQLRKTAQDNGTITITLYGTVPTVDIPIVITGVWDK